MSELEHLKSTWQSASGISSERFSKLSEAVQKNTRSTQKVVLHRDVAESAAAFVILVFGITGISSSKNWLDFIGFAVLIAVCVEIPVVLWLARRRTLQDISSSNYADFLADEIHYLRRQVRLLKHVVWWYLLPIYTSMTLVCLGVSYPEFSVWITAYLGLCGAVCIYLWRLNQKARKARLEPLLDYYLKLQMALESGEDGSESLSPPPEIWGQSTTRQPMTRGRRIVFVVLTFLLTTSIAACGWWLTRVFDERAGWFVLSMAPFVGLLTLIATGAYRRG
ncbi:MAG: hypothetical protein AAGI63_11370 [Planctomycetota bacterium]